MSDEKNKNLDDVFSMLDQITDDHNTSSLDEVRSAAYSSNMENLVSLVGKTVSQSNIVRKPELPQITDDFISFYDCFVLYLQGVNYGVSNSVDYVDGHRRALEKYYADADANKNNLYVTEARLNDEIYSVSREYKTTLYAKGYYDGLNFVQRALKRAKDKMAARIYSNLKKELG